MLPTQVVALLRRSPGGLITLRQLQSLGFDRRTVARWLRAGLEQILPGVYREAGVPVPSTQRLHLPLRYLERPTDREPSALISGEAMLVLAEVEGCVVPELPLALIDRDRRCRLSDAPFRIARVALQAIPRELHRGIATADPAQALADVAWDTDRPDREVRVMVDAVRSSLRIPIVHLVSRWQEIGHPGARRLLRMSPAFEQESEGEREAFATLFPCCPPLPDCQVVLVGSLRVDFVYLSAALVIEYLGEAHDGKADTDATRSFALEGPGYRVISVTRSMLRDPRPTATHIQRLRRDRERLVAEGRLVLPPLPPQPPRLVPLRSLRSAT